MAENSQKLSIGLVYDDTLDGSDGVAQYVKSLGAWLSQKGHHVFYMAGETTASSWAGGTIYSLAKNLTIKFNGNRMSIPLVSRKSGITKVLEQEQPDIIHVMMPYSPLMSGRVIKRSRKTSAVVVTFHIYPSGPLTSLGSRVLRVIQYFSIKKIDARLAVSRPAADFAKQAFKIDAKIVPNMVDIANKVALKQPDPKSKQIVFMGRLVNRKGCAELIKAFALLLKRIPDAQLSICGKGPERKKLETLTRKLGINNSVKFQGYISEADKPRILGEANIACYPSLYGESFGIVLVEAMAYGAGVVLGGDNPGYRSVLADQPKTLINPKDTEEFALRLQELLEDQQLASKLHVWQTEHVKQFDTNVVGQQIEAVYYQTIAKKRAIKA